MVINSLSNPDNWIGRTRNSLGVLDVPKASFGRYHRLRKDQSPWLPGNEGVRVSLTEIQVGSLQPVPWPANGIFRIEETPSPPNQDRAGTLSTGVIIQGTGVEIESSILDVDGIASIDAASILATDGRLQDISDEWDRYDPTVFSHSDTRRGSRWRSATMSVTYTDGNGVQSTLTGSWNIQST